MGCCCDEEKADILKHLTNSHFASSSPKSPGPSSPSSFTVISPMNSHFSVLACRDTLCIIFHKLPISDLARINCVCRLWNSVTFDREIVARAFLAP
ncbi:F-box protein [Senna tora]|uniref:F-box protein n=1 Tax=Senna tora TaxID=362788 RepID=A0A834XEQ6_9FABA|nr:F-box protein [Senna tora]